MPAIQSMTRRPPGPEHAVPLGIDPQTLETLTGLRRDFGDIVSVEKPSGRIAYFINDPAEVRRILVRQHACYAKGPGFERVKMLLGNGLIVSDGEVWRRSRTMIQPAFKVQNVQRLIRVMVECTERRVRDWRVAATRGEAINITQQTSDFALELILKCIFGADYENRLLAGGENPFDFLSKNSARDLGVVLKARQLRELLLEIIALRRESVGQEFDFLSMYLQALDREGRPFTDRELLDELMTLIVAGFETSANTLNWAWYLLSGDAEAEAAVVSEAARELPLADSATGEQAAAMSYTQQVLEETLRLYPPVWLFTRRAIASDKLEMYDVPPGTDIYLSPYILHRSDEFWPEPERFDPSRFAALDAPRKERPYFPFSLGPRRCLGEYFSFLEMKLHLGLLLPRFRMQRTDDVVPDLELGINLRSKRDIFLRPVLRQTAVAADRSEA
jgi:enediyne biosynthesis protein E7